MGRLPGPQERRRERLAAELKANLRRRKERSRALKQDAAQQGAEAVTDNSGSAGDDKRE